VATCSGAIDCDYMSRMKKPEESPVIDSFRSGWGTKGKRALRALQGMTRSVSGRLSLDEMITSTLEAVGTHLSPDVALLYLREGKELSAKGVWGRNDRFRSISRNMHTVGQCLCGLAAEGQAVYSDNIHADPRCTHDECRKAGLRSFAALPLMGEGTVIGVLGLGASRRRTFKSQSAFLETAAGIAASAIQNTLWRAQDQRAEARLRKSEERFRDLFENATDLIQIVSPEGRLLYVNRSWRETLGYSEEEIEGLSLPDIIDPTCDEHCNKTFGKILSEGVAEDIETVFIAKDGRKVSLEGSGHCKYEGGKPGSVRCMFRNVTSRKAAEDALRESERKYRNLSQEFQALLNAIPDNLTLQDPDLKIVWANQGAASGLGRSATDLEGRYCFSLWHQRLAPCASCPVQESFRTGTPCTRQVTTPDGQVWELRSVPITDEQGVITKVVEVGRNITENSRLQAQLLQAQKMESVGRLAGGVAHDFNNILSAIVGFGNLLQLKMADDDSNRVYLDNILLSAEKAAGLTQSLLAFSRQQVIKPALIDINEVIRRVEKLLVRIIGEDIKFQTDLSTEKLVVMADPLQMEQVLMNLATNARDAMPGGGQLVIATDQVVFDEDYIKTHGYGRPGRYALISVTDTGMGMDEEIQSRLFEPFFTTKDVGKGTGLGLAIIYGIVKQHEGYINLYSEPGAGTTFKIYLPARDTGASQEEIPKEMPLPALRGSETILLVEDDSEVRRATKTMLDEFGYSVIEAVDGVDAIMKFRLHHDSIDLLLLDVIMPGKNGGEVYAEAQAINPSVRVLFTSGYPADIIKTHVVLEEGLHFLSKPAAPQALLKKIRELIEK